MEPAAEPAGNGADTLEKKFQQETSQLAQQVAVNTHGGARYPSAKTQGLNSKRAIRGPDGGFHHQGPPTNHDAEKT